VPLAEAVVFAMLASYLLSRTLVPTLAKYWLRRHEADASARPGLFARFQARFEQGFARWRNYYRALLERALTGGSRFALPFLAAMAATAVLAFPMGRYLPGLGQDYFPSVDAGQIRLHLRARTGLRIDETAALCDQVEDTIRRIIPARELVTIVDNIGIPYSGINLTYSTSAPIGPSDADIYVSLGDDHHPTADYVRTLRMKLPQLYPATLFTFPPADIVSQILNFGLPAPLDVQVAGFNVEGNRQYANLLLERMRSVPGAVDLRVHQVFDYPQLDVDVDRSKAALLGVTERDVASNLLTSLSGSFQTAPSFWIDPNTGTQYSVTAQTPQYKMTSLDDLAATPLSASAGGAPQMLSNLATFRRSVAPGVVSHYDSMPVLDIYGAVQDTDLGFISDQVYRLIAETRHDVPRGTRVVVRGQIKTMTDSFHGLLEGLAGAVVLIYLLIVVNFQSWRDPFIIITALPAALAGIVWMLFLTRTPVSVPALMGAIMCMGVATANSVLVISFARQRMDAGDDALQAALTAGYTRFRPVIMTALAMIVGMVPMALGIGEGAEQNAPLGRAVIGGLIFATVATLFFVPTVFVMIHGRKTGSPESSGVTQ
jgi:multidrug efflux pump subunit AcrB